MNKINFLNSYLSSNYAHSLQTLFKLSFDVFLRIFFSISPLISIKFNQKERDLEEKIPVCKYQSEKKKKSHPSHISLKINFFIREF